MILPLEIGGKPFEGVALIAIGVRIASIWRNWRTWPVGPPELFLNAASIVFLLFLGMQNIEVVKPWILVLVILSLLSFVALVGAGQFLAAFAGALSIAAYMVAYFIIDTDFDSAVWVILGVTVFGSSAFVANLVNSARASRSFVFFSETSRDIEKRLASSQKLREARVEKLELELKKLGSTTDAEVLRSINKLELEKLAARKEFLEGELKLAGFRYDINAARRLGRGDRAAEAIRRANEKVRNEA